MTLATIDPKAPRWYERAGRWLRGGPREVALGDVRLGNVRFDEVFSHLQVMEMAEGAPQTREQLGQVAMMIDAQGWTPMFADLDEVTTGLSLDTLRDVSKQTREMVIGNVWMKQGQAIRVALVMGSGCEWHDRKVDGGRKRLPKRIRDLIDEPVNQAGLLGATARASLEGAAFTDGLVIGTVDTRPGRETLGTFPLLEMTAHMTNPDRTSEVWMYRREWVLDPNKPADESNTVVRWYYTDRFDPRRHGRKRTTITYWDKVERVDPNVVIVDKAFNSQLGFSFGIPDSLGALAWAKLYKEFLVNGYVMSRALAQIAYKVTAKTARERQAAAVAIARPKEAGNAATMSGDSDLLPLATAGKGYDFSSGRPLAAAIASGLQISVDALLAGTGGDTVNSGVADLVTGPQQAMAIMRRQEWDEFWTRIFRLLGVKNVGTIWHDVTELQLQRVLQSWTLAHNTGLFAGKVIQSGIADAMGLPDAGEIPEGYIPPNNEAGKTLPAGGDTSNTDPDDQSDTSLNPSAGTGQGRGGDGTGGLGNDHSTDEG